MIHFPFFCAPLGYPCCERNRRYRIILIWETALLAFIGSRVYAAQWLGVPFFIFILFFSFFAIQDKELIPSIDSTYLFCIPTSDQCMSSVQRLYTIVFYSDGTRSRPPWQPV